MCERFWTLPKNASTGVDITQAIKPLDIDICLADFNHAASVALWLHAHQYVVLLLFKRPNVFNQPTQVGCIAVVSDWPAVGVLHEGQVQQRSTTGRIYDCNRSFAHESVVNLCSCGRSPYRAFYVLPNRSAIFSSNRFPCITATIRLLMDSTRYTNR